MKSTDIVQKIPDIQYREEPPAINAEEFRKVITSRRSVRIFDGTPIPEAIMRDCLDLALLAPNSSNLQPWEFYWVRTAEKKQKVVEYCLSQPAAKTAAELIICAARTGTWHRNSRIMLDRFKKLGDQVPASAIAYYRKVVPVFYAQGFLDIFGWIKRLFLFCYGLFKPVPREPTSRHEMVAWAIKSTALAAENLMLALRAHGFDSCPLEGFDSRRLRKLLNLPSDAHIALVVTAGKRADNGVYGPRIRFEPEHFLFEI